jgi:hypothetical protein
VLVARSIGRDVVAQAVWHDDARCAWEMTRAVRRHDAQRTADDAWRMKRHQRRAARARRHHSHRTTPRSHW